jgi:hypothetical protein
MPGGALSHLRRCKRRLSGIGIYWALDLATKGMTANGGGRGVVETEMLTHDLARSSDRANSLEASIAVGRTGSRAGVAALEAATP